MSIEDLPSWVYSFLIIPLGVMFQKHFTLKNRVTILETNQTIYIKKIDDICESNAELAKQVNQMLGRMDEHLRNN